MQKFLSISLRFGRLPGLGYDVTEMNSRELLQGILAGRGRLQGRRLLGSVFSRCLRDFFDPRWIVSPSHEALLPNVPPEIVAAMAEAAHEPL